MKIKLKIERQVYGQPLQKPGDIIDIADEEAARLIALKQAVSAETKGEK